MTNQNGNQMAAAKADRKLIKLSACGKWESYLSHAGLMRYIPSGVFYVRVKVDGIVKRASLETDVKTTALDRMAAKKNEIKKPAPQVGTFAEARAVYEADLEADATLSAASKYYRRSRIAALVKSWPGLDALPLTKITPAACKDWAARYCARFDAQNFNNTLGSLRAIIALGGLKGEANPTHEVKRMGVKPTELHLPELAQFDLLVKTVADAGSRHSKHCAAFIQFLAFSGCRVSEARSVTWGDIDFARQEIRIQSAKVRRTNNSNPLRYIPMIPKMRALLDTLKDGKQPGDKVCIVGECEKSMTAACKRLNIPRLTHHDLRHFFASVCIESGVDIPTVSRWLGHSDGGALAMKTYGHLRREHSQSMAQRVTFGLPAAQPLEPLSA